MRDYRGGRSRVYAAGLSAGAAPRPFWRRPTRPLCGHRRAFRPRLRRGQRRPLGLRGNAPKWAGGKARVRRQLVQQREYSRIVPAIVFHGDQDTTVHPNNGDQVIAQLRKRWRPMQSNGREPAGSPAGVPTPAPSSATQPTARFSSSGLSTAPAMPGQAAVPPVPTPIRRDRTPSREMLRFFLDHPFG